MTLENHVLRVFEVRAKPGCADRLEEKLSDTSVAVVKGRPGNRGHWFGKLESSDGNDLVFISVWSELDAVRRQFGDDWERSYLPQGYEEMIESCSVKHFTVSGELDR